jgi:hypothetical protein
MGQAIVHVFVMQTAWTATNGVLEDGQAEQRDRGHPAEQPM